jgi:2-polyprenyl-6-hydroxyphenyl methylase/3-demethylubiquinone-9 3-methyltransferase
MRKLLQMFVATQQRWCRIFDTALNGRFAVDGASHFGRVFVPAQVRPNMTVYDVGGGKHPFFGNETKAQLRLKVYGIDITEQELKEAPVGAYDGVICRDICSYAGDGTADLVVCQAVLEHVNDTDAAVHSFASLLKPGAAALVFVPCRNAIFARLNTILPEKLKRTILFTLFPTTQRAHGFPAHYDRCAPRDFIAMARVNNLQVEAIESYYMSAYFSFFLPAHIMWRIWQGLSLSVVGDQACESFSVVLRKPQTPEPSSDISNAFVQRRIPEQSH